MSNLKIKNPTTYNPILEYCSKIESAEEVVGFKIKRVIRLLQIVVSNLLILRITNCMCFGKTKVEVIMCMELQVICSIFQ